MNPITSTGPDWRAILPARLYQISLSELSPLDGPTLSEQLFSRMTLPKAIKVPKYPGQPLRFLHIVKTGGESLQGYLDSATSPAYDFSTCRASAMASASEIPESIDSGCLAWANIVSTALCGLNCECCAADIRLPGGDGLHGTLLRSPRAHALSLFSHGHIAHHSSWSRMIADISLYLAEGVLRYVTPWCASSCCARLRVFGLSGSVEIGGVVTVSKLILTVSMLPQSDRKRMRQLFDRCVCGLADSFGGTALGKGSC